jgi:ferredoxin
MERKMDRRIVLKILGFGMIMPTIFAKKAFATSSYFLHKDLCINCGRCIDVAPHCFQEADGHVEFSGQCGATGGPDYHYGCSEYEDMQEAMAGCPVEAIEEIGK